MERMVKHPFFIVINLFIFKKICSRYFNVIYMPDDRLYQIALTMVQQVGPIQAKLLLQQFGSGKAVFEASKKELCSVENMSAAKADSIKTFNEFAKAENEVVFLDRYRIKTLSILDAAYPQRLLNCYDAPSLLFYKGSQDLNSSRMVSIIGTRNNTDYGRQLTEKLITDLKDQNVVIISGLAFGIDAIAHKTALKNEIPTIGVLAHGLDNIYPGQHQSLAKEMVGNGGLLTECFRNTKPDRHNFPRRNRIVAGMTDATIVIETAIKGGSMITAKLAFNYNRDVFAFPGRVNDAKSAGNHYLIQQNMAYLLTDAGFLLKTLGWQKRQVSKQTQRELFVELTENEKTIVNMLQQKENVHIDEICLNSGLSSSSVAAAILQLEMQNVIVGLPGKMFRLM